MKTVIRTFFRTLRIVLGPVMLLKERLTQPTGVQRPPAAQAAVDQQCQSLALYQFSTCPFCIKVRQEMRRLSLPIEKLDAQHHTAHRDALLQGTGATQVPCLQITEADGQTRWLKDSGAIVTYLRERFATPAV
jgi:glutaredoxin